MELQAVFPSNAIPAPFPSYPLTPISWYTISKKVPVLLNKMRTIESWTLEKWRNDGQTSVSFTN